jgi:hypothetical protein
VTVVTDGGAARGNTPPARHIATHFPPLPGVPMDEVDRQARKEDPMDTLITPPLAQDNEYLQATLAVAIGQMKGLHAMITALMAEVAALRKTVAEKPENVDQYQSNLKAAMETAKPFVDDAMQTYDEMIELVCSTDAWKN